MSPPPDIEKYRPHVAHLDIPEERKTELLRALWHIMQNFVDRAFGDDPVQQALGRAGGKSHREDAQQAPAMIESTTENPDNNSSLVGVFQKQARKRHRGK